MLHRLCLNVTCSARSLWNFLSLESSICLRSYSSLPALRPLPRSLFCRFRPLSALERVLWQLAPVANSLYSQSTTGKACWRENGKMSHSAAPKTREAAGQDLPSRLGLTCLGTWDPASKNRGMSPIPSGPSPSAESLCGFGEII